ncbi:titin isoform X3 [Cryptotermes secundus]|uniref:titin isoform X3 n=1 Tax=Cryptotermes secundus TaxID=105785 RepID=UPI000CD7B88B|nr:titin isoform X3 [Cryptotermes secundus]
MDVAESDADGNLNNEKEGEVSSTCSDSLPASAPTTSLAEIIGDCDAPSSLIQEEIVHSDSPDTSGEMRVRSEAEQSLLSDDTEHVATVQSLNTAAVEQENLQGVDAEMFQHLPDESIELLHISEDSEIVLLDENVVISTTSEPTTFIMSYENQEEMQGAEMSTTNNKGFQLAIPQSVNVSSAKTSDIVEAGDVVCNKTRMYTWNPDSTTVETTEESSDKNEIISFTEEEVSTTEEDVGSVISTSNVVTPVSASGENTPVPSITKAKSVSGARTQDIVQDMETSQSHIEGSVLNETAPQNSGISTTSMKDISRRKRRWDQVKFVMETSATEQAGSDFQASGPERQIFNILSQPSTSKQESHVTVPEQSVCTSKKPKENNSLPNQIQDCVSSSKDVDIVTELSASADILTGHQESDIDTTTNVHTVPQLYSALDLIKSNYCSPFDDEIPSPGSSTHEDQKHIHDSTKETDECITSNTSLNDSLKILTKDQSSNSASSEGQTKKVISSSVTRDENLEGKTSENKLKGNVKISASSPGLSKESKEKKEVVVLEKTSAAAGSNLHQPTASVGQADTVLSTVSTRTTVKHYARQQTSLAKQIATSCGKSSVDSRTNLVDVKEIISSNKNSSVLVAAEERADVGCLMVTEPVTRQKDSSAVTDVSAIKQEPSGVTEASAGIQSSYVTKLPTSGKEPLTVITETLLTTEESSIVTKSALSQEKSSVLVETSTGTDSVDDIKAPISGQQCLILMDVLTGKDSEKQMKEKDPVVTIETSVKGTETVVCMTEGQKVKEKPDDGRKVSTEEQEFSVLGTKLYVIGEETSVAEQMPMKEKKNAHSTTLTLVKEEDASFVDTKLTPMGMEEASENKHPSVKVKECPANDEKICGILRGTSGIDLHRPKTETEISVRQTKMKESESSPTHFEVKETSAASRSGEESLVSDAQATLTGNKQLPDKEEHTEIIHESSKKMGIISSETQILIKEEGIDVTKTRMSTENEGISYIGPQFLERGKDISSLEEQVKEKETSTEARKHIALTAVQMPVIKEETNITDTHTRKKDMSLGSPEALEKDCENVMEVPEVNTVTADQMLSRNKDKEIIRKRLAEVIARQKVPTDSNSCGPGTTAMKTQTVTDKEFPVLAENLAAAMKETIKKAISRMPEKSYSETVAPEHTSAADMLLPLEADVAVMQEAASSASTILSTESNKETTDISLIEGLAKMTEYPTVEENLTSVTRKPPLSLNLSAKTEDPLHKIGTSTTTDSNLTEISVYAKEAVSKAETSSTKQTIFKHDSTVTENLILSEDVGKGEKMPRKNLAVEGNTGSSRKERQKLTESSGAVTNEGLKPSVSPATKQRVKLVRPVLSRPKEVSKPEHSSSLAPTEVTKPGPLSSPTFKNTVTEIAMSSSQKECKQIKMPDTVHSVSSTERIKTPAGELKEENLPSKALLKEYEQSEFPTVTESKEIEHLDIATKILTKKVDNPDGSHTMKTTEVLKTSGLLEDNKQSGKEQSSSFSVKESIAVAADVLKSTYFKQTSKEITQLEVETSSPTNVQCSETSQSTLPASLTSEDIKDSVVQNVTKPERDKCLEQPGLLLQKDSGVPEKDESSSVLKLQDDYKDKNRVSESLKKPKLIRHTTSGSNINKTKLTVEETFAKEGLKAIIIKQHAEQSSLSEKKVHEKTFSSIKTKILANPDDSTTLISSSNGAGNQESNVQNISEAHRMEVTADTVDPSSRSDKERCQLNVGRKETEREPVHGIVATNIETSEIGIPHSTNFGIPKEEFISTAQIRESKEDVFRNDKINTDDANSPNNKSEQRGELVTVQSQFKIESGKIDTENVSCSTNIAEVSAEVCSEQTENTNGSMSAQSGTSSVMLKKPAFGMKSVLIPECSRSTDKMTLRLDTEALKVDDEVLKPKVVEVIPAEDIILEQEAEAELVKGNLQLEESKDRCGQEVKLGRFSAEKKSEISINISKPSATKTLDIEETKSSSESKSDKNIKQDKIILKITKDMTASKESSSAVKESQPESKSQYSESILKEATANTVAGSKPETSIESRVLSPDSSVISKERAKVEKLTLKLNKDPVSDSFTKDGTSSKSSWTSTVSSNIGLSETPISPKHENMNMKLKKDSSSMSFKATSIAGNTEVLPRTENADEGARVEKRTLKLKRDVSKVEDTQKECVEEPKLEKITLKFKKDPAHPDIIVATTSMVMPNPGEVITTRSSGIEQVETVASSALQDESKPQKITLKLKKDGAKQETVTVSSEDVPQDTSAIPVQSAEIKLPEIEDVSADKVTQRLKKDGSKSEALALPSKESISHETTIIPVKLKDGKIQEKPISPHSKYKPAIEKLTLKLKKDDTTAAASKEEGQPETTVTRVKASEVKQSNENTSLGRRIEPLVEKITLKLKKDTTKPETAIYPETSVTQVKTAEQLKPEADASVSPKEDPLVEKITLKLKKEGAKPDTIMTSKRPSSHETTVTPTKITDIKQKQSEASVPSLTTESTVVEKITLKIKKDPTKQEVIPVTAKQGPTKLPKGGTSVQQEEPKLEKLTLKLKKDAIKSVMCGKEVEPSKQPDIITKLDLVAKEENKVEKLTLKLKKDSGISEIITGKKIPEQGSVLVDVQSPEESVVVSSKEEGKVEKLMLKLKRTDHPEGDLEVSSTQTEEEKCEDSAGTSITNEGKVEKITLKLWKDLTKSEESVFATPKDTGEAHGASDHLISGDQEIKLSDETSSEGGKPKKITLTLKKDAAWSVKRKIGSDCCDNSEQTSSDEINKLATEDQFAEILPKRAKIEEIGAFEKSESYVTSSVEPVIEISKVSKEHFSELEKSETIMEVINKLDIEEKHLQRPQKDFRRQSLESRRPEEECPDKRIKLEHELKSDSKSEHKMPKSQNKESIFQHDQGVSSQISHSKLEYKRMKQGEIFEQTAVEGKLREILSKIGPRTSTIMSGDLSIRFAPIKTPSSGKLCVVSDVSVTSSHTEMMEVNVSNSTGSEDVQFCNSNIMQQSASTSKHCGEAIGEGSSSQDVLIIKEENQPNSSVHMSAEKMVDVGMVVPDYHTENIITEKSQEVKPAETEIVKTEPKKGRGRPRKTALVPSVIPVIEPPPEQVLRPKRMCRGRERPPVVVKVRKPRTGKAPGRKKKIVEEIKPAPEMEHPAKVSTLSEKSSASTKLSTSVDTIDHLVSFPVIEQPALAVKSRQVFPVIPADQSRSITPAELHVPSSFDEPPIKTPYALEHPSSSDSVKASPPVCIIAESSAEVNSLTAPAEMLSTPEITPSPSSPCHTTSVSTVQVFEEETRMSAESGSRSQTPAHTLPPAGGADGPGEESQGSAISTATTESVKKKGRVEIGDGQSREFTVEQVVEYQWPLEKGGESLMIQEQISEYLGVKSFKRKYPDLKRRIVEAEEKAYLREKGLVTESLCDLGLTAVNSSEILDIMYSDFQEKYEEYRRFMRDRQTKDFTTKPKGVTSATNVEKNKLDYKDKAIRSAATWNSTFNRSRRDQRRCCFDLQSFTIHYPYNKRVKALSKEPTKPGPYPLSLIPGQYTDYYKSYTPTELRYFPLSTVVYGPMKPNERQEPGACSDLSQSDSDDSSSFDDSSTSSEETQDTEETGSTTGDADPENSQDQSNQESGDKDGDKDQTTSVKVKEEKKDKDREGAICKVCSGDHTKNKDGHPEVLIHCAQCTSSGHPSCLDLTLDMVPHIRRYDWQCTDCKTCIQCKDPADEDKMLFCDMCDRGYHIYCVGLRRVPSGRWHCKECAVCGSCGTQEPAGNNPDTPNAQWQHEYKKGEKGTRVYAQTLCVPCSKLWRKGRYCQLCWRCYGNKPDEEDGLINCSVCDKWMHAECCSAIGGSEVDRTSNFLCEICQEKGQARSPAIKMTPRSILKV